MDPRRDLHDDDALDALLREALDRSGRPAPFAVDVADAVMARVAEAGPAPIAELGWRQLGRWAMAAALFGAALFVAAAWHGPSIGEIAQQLGRTTSGTVETAAKLSAPAATVAAATSRSAAALLDAARTLARPLASMMPLAELMLFLIAAAMAGFTAVVVGRDFRLRAPQKEQA